MSHVGPVLFVNISSAVCGAYIWEFTQSLRFDLQLFHSFRQRPSWVKVIYILCRYLALASAGLSLWQFNGKPTACKAPTLSSYAAAIIGIFFASTLIAIRTVAIWEWNKSVTFIVAVGLFFQLASTIYNFAQFHDGMYEDRPQSCVVAQVNPQAGLICSVSVLACDVILAGCMLLGLLRQRIASGIGLWRFLWHQGLLWVALAALAEVPMTILITLNLDWTADDVMFYLSVFTLIISATRLYRSLSTFSRNYDPARFVSTIR